MYHSNPIRIPNKDQWTITLWHIGRDSLQEYSGDKFHCSWQVAKNFLLRVYSKEMKLQNNKKTTIIRMETQDNPEIMTKQLADFIKNSNESLPSKLIEKY